MQINFLIERHTKSNLKMYLRRCRSAVDDCSVASRLRPLLAPAALLRTFGSLAPTTLLFAFGAYYRLLHCFAS